MCDIGAFAPRSYATEIDDGIPNNNKQESEDMYNNVWHNLDSLIILHYAELRHFVLESRNSKPSSVVPTTQTSSKIGYFCDELGDNISDM